MTGDGSKRHVSPTQRTQIGCFLVLLACFGAFAPKFAAGWVPHLVPNWLGASHFATVAVNQNSLGELALVGGCTREALAAVEDEYEQVRAERDAFRDFVESVRDLSVPPRRTGGTNAVTLVEPNVEGRRLRTIRERYRGTVMAVGHYDDEYGEDLRTNVAAEFDEHVATAVVDGTRFSRELKQLLVRHGLDAARRREDFMTAVQRERDAIVEVGSRLREPDALVDELTESNVRRHSFSALLDRERELRRELRRCERLLTDRQREIHASNERVPGEDRLSLQQYLYGHLDATFPVLNAVLERIRRLRARRRAVIRELVRRA